MSVRLIKRGRNEFEWRSVGLYFPWPEFGKKYFSDWNEEEKHYGIEFNTKIKFFKSMGFLRFDFQVLGFGFYYCRQWDY